jgi:hypothetical protein
MLYDGIQLVEGADISNLTVDSGTSFPSNPSVGELFYKTSATVGLYVYSGSAWAVVGSGGASSFTITGDVTGTIDGAPDVLTLATVNSNVGSFGTASSVPTLTVSAKGLVTAAANTSIQVTESQVTDGSLLSRNAADETITGNWTFNNAVSGATPTVDAHLATKQYVDSVASGLDPKDSVRAGTTSNITLNGAQTVDGVSLVAGDRVLVKNQSTATQNGIYVVATGAWSRSTDFDGTPSSEVSAGAFTFITEGSTNADTGWVLTTNDPITLGSTALSWAQFSASTTTPLTSMQIGYGSSVNTLTGSSQLTWDNTNRVLELGSTVSANSTTIRGMDGATLAAQLIISGGLGGGSQPGGELSLRAGRSASASGGGNTGPNLVLMGGGGGGSGGAGGVIAFFTAATNNNFVERVQIANNGAIGLGGANFGTSGQVLTSQGSGSAAVWQTAPGGVTGANTQVQFNNSGAAGASANFTWDGSALNVGTTSATGLLGNRVRSTTGTLFSGQANFSVAGFSAGTLMLSASFGDTPLAIGTGNTTQGATGAQPLILFTDNTERLRIAANGSWALASSFGTSGQVLTCQGSGAAPIWQDSANSNIPLSTTTSGTLTATDAGTAVPATGNITVPASVFSGGQVLSIYNDTATTLTITQGSGLTMRLVGTSGTGNRTLTQRGWMTVWFRSATECVVSGGGVQ